MDTFAKKLAAGLVDVPGRLSWWPRHSRQIIRYLFLGDKPASEIEKARHTIELGCKEWEACVPVSVKTGLMGHHCSMEMSLVDASRGDKRVGLDKLGALLVENAEEITASFGSCIVEFPKHAFYRLFLEHVASFTEIVKLRLEGASRRSGERMEKSTVALAAFTGEWF